jgi:hypothetical protein
MAKSVKELQAEFDKVSRETQLAYDVLHPPFGNSERLLAYEYEKAIKDGDKKAIKELKPLYDSAEAKYKDAQTRKNALRKELNAAKKSETETKTKTATVKGANNLYNQALKDLQVAERGIEGYQGEQKYIDAYRKAESAFNTLTDSGTTPKVALPIAKITIPPVEAGAQVGADGKPVASKEPTISEFVSTVTNPENKQLLIDVQKDLAKNFGYTGPIDGSPSTSFLPALNNAYKQRASLPEAWRGSGFREFLTNPGVGATSGTGGTGGTGAANAWTTISSESQAKSAINEIFQTELNRDATPAEIKKLYPELKAAQAANPSKQKIVKGVQQTIGGLNVGQWITDKARALPEYEKKKTEKSGGTKEDIIASLNANGLPVDDSQVNEWVNQVENGGSVDAIKRGIRNVAAIGQPDSIKKLIAEGTDLATIYSPYKTAMAKALEIPVDSIQLDDPTLRQAIGPDKEMSIYDFQKALRTDQRWQYTDQARSEASDVATKVLQDFGFMG